MTNRVDQIRTLLTQALEPISLEIVDDSAAHAGHAGARDHGGGHFQVHIVSNKFNTLSTIKRHQLVYQALQSMMPSDIHALSIQAISPHESKP
ncbi:MAG: BolA family transcriptional regulator [Gammaproteobacteria bacterium]|nr:BolA family transcriptional regulator [Gammaproteobacteria bacterium]